LILVRCIFPGFPHFDALMLSANRGNVISLPQLCPLEFSSMFLFLFIFLLLALAPFKGSCLELKSFYPKEQCHLVALGMAFRETPGEAACIKHEPVFCLVSQYWFILTSCICRAIHLSPVPRHVSNLSPNRLPSFHSPFQVSRFLFAGGKLEREESRN